MAAPSNFFFDPAKTVRADYTILSAVELDLSIPHQSGEALGQIRALDPVEGILDDVTLLDDAGGAFFLDHGILRYGAEVPLPGDHQITLSVRNALGEELVRTVTVTVPAWTAVIADPTSGDDDIVTSGSTNSTVLAGAGNDTITATSSDVVRYEGNRADYDIQLISTGGGYGSDGSGGSYGSGPDSDTWQVTDLRPGGPDGVDMILTTAPRFQFADGLVTGAMLQGENVLTIDGKLLETELAFAENPAVGSVLGQLALSDGTATEITGYEVRVIQGLDLVVRNDLFSVDVTGQIIVDGSINREEYDAFFINVTYMDHGVERSQSLDLRVLDAPDPVSGVTLQNLDHGLRLLEHENATRKIHVGDILPGFDEDVPVGGYEYAIVGANADRFTLDGNEIFLKAGAFVDFETEPVVSIGIEVREVGLVTAAPIVFTVQVPVDFAALRSGAVGERLDASTGYDVVYGGSGNDTLIGMAGDDTEVGGDGDDRIQGGAGQDLLFGDGQSLVQLHWANLGAPGTDVASGGRLDLGLFDAVVTHDLGVGATITLTNTAEFSDPADELAADSGLALIGRNGAIATTTITLMDGSTAVEASGGLRFRLNDLDQNVVNDIFGGVFIDWINSATIRAFDAQGNAVAVTITPGEDLRVLGQTVTPIDNGDRASSDPVVSALVTVAPGVHRLEIEMRGEGSEPSLITLTDVAFIIDDTTAITGGNDTLNAGDGNDTLTGGMGDDLLNGNGGEDTALFLGTSTMVVDLRGRLATGQGSDELLSIENVITGSGNDHLLGSGFDNRLEGGAGNDFLVGRNGDDDLFGGEGRDRLNGGAGQDVLSGGAGADVFLFNENSDTDVITDYELGLDRIRLADALWGGGLTAAEVVAAHASLAESGVRLDFGSAVLVIANLHSLEGLAGDLQILAAPVPS